MRDWGSVRGSELSCGNPWDSHSYSRRLHALFLNFFTLTEHGHTLSWPWSQQPNDVMSEIECAQLHNELLGRRNSTLQSHGLFALAKYLFTFRWFGSSWMGCVGLDQRKWTYGRSLIMAVVGFLCYILVIMQIRLVQITLFYLQRFPEDLHRMYL